MNKIGIIFFPISTGHIEGASSIIVYVIFTILLIIIYKKIIIKIY